MLLRRGKIENTGCGTGSLTTAIYEICWHGLVYMKGTPAGAPSVRKFARAAEISVANAAAELKGIFFMAVQNRRSGECYAFVDNSGLFHAYESPHFVGTSFLELARLEGSGPEDFEPESVVEFLHFGTIGFGESFLPQIRKIEPDAIISVDAAGTKRVIRKPIPDIAAAPDQAFEVFLEDFASSVEGMRISLDLTGGVDSRLLAVALSYYGLPFELAASGTPGNSDLRIAECVAKMLGRDFVQTHHDPAGTDWERVFEVCDGMFDPAKADRSLQLQRDRKRRGMELAVSGAGGELFKDFWWLQDFPFYNRQRSSLPKLYAMRIAGTEPCHSYLTGGYYNLSKTHRSRTLLRLSPYIARINTQTYDRVYYFFKMREFAGRFLTSSLHSLLVYAPYLERDAVRVGYGLPRWRRFFNQYHRELVTRFHPAAARIPTTEGGMTASSRSLDLASDLARYVVDRSTRLAKKAGQKALSRTYFQENADHPNMSVYLRELAIARRSVQKLQEHGILSRWLQVETIRSSYLGTILILDWLFEKLEEPVAGSHRQRMMA